MSQMKSPTMKTRTKTKKIKISEGGRVRLSVQHEDEMRFYDLLYPQMQSTELERALAKAVSAYAHSFVRSVRKRQESAGDAVA